ncbi:Trigalactosyldiacylglycerol 1 isoform 2 [Hibiscus syriacus]|uniref:Trigalactosyldiacylglycerol 1 isoform 2 n=1 Tax=Hibiscus syriacus TaxID=106335 RepID=A0A6A3BKC7_HIBSY|nr:Trigalactosyldiacylglycerol 1 isoform 2 [Hibiscus syriacus]
MLNTQNTYSNLPILLILHPTSHYGISEDEGSSLLGDEDPSLNIRRKCLEWCIDHNIEFIEACASNADLDKCLSVDGDLQGVERLFGALSAYMWPGMVLKSDSSEEEPDYQFDYEVLSAGSAEPGDDVFEEWGNITGCKKEEPHDSPTVSASGEKIDRMEPNRASATELDDCSHYAFEDLEQLMSGIGSIHSNLRLKPDFQRREMAAKLPFKMAAMFGGGSDDEEEI